MRGRDEFVLTGLIEIPVMESPRLLGRWWRGILLSVSIDTQATKLKKTLVLIVTTIK